MLRRINWGLVVHTLCEWARERNVWKAGQEKSVKWLASNLEEKPGLLIADEVGLGKTRIAVAAAAAVIRNGGRVVVLIPPGLKDQWENEFKQLYKALKDEAEMTEMPTSHFLRTYDSLFENVCGKPFWTANPPLVFVSHRFGIPQRLTDTGERKSHYLRWFFPLLVRWHLVENKNEVYGLGKYTEKKQTVLEPKSVKEKLAARHNAQLAGAKWLAKNAGMKLVEKIRLCELLKPKERPTVFANEPEAKSLFHRMIGELIGPVDLIVVDEAHKNRVGAQESVEKAASSRLSECINNILRPVSHKRTKYLALTATPLELTSDQWGDVLARIGMLPNDVKCKKDAATQFANVLKRTVWHSELDLQPLLDAKELFVSKFQGWLSRRRWSDHERIKECAELLGDGKKSAHPHRKWFINSMPLMKMNLPSRNAILASEGLAQVAKASNAPMTSKLMGLRYSDGCVVVSPEGATEKAQGQAQVSMGSDGRQKREKFWRCLSASSVHNLLHKGNRKETALHCHPRIEFAVEKIESLLAEDRDCLGYDYKSKVLVFCAFNAPLLALTQALNIRAFLKDLKKGVPTSLPAPLHSSDAEVSYWATKLDISVDIERVERLSKAYGAARTDLRKACGILVRSWTTQPHRSLRTEISTETESLIVDWLVFNLPLTAFSDDLRSTGVAERLLEKLFDVDPPEDASEAAGEIEVSAIDEKSICESIREEMPVGGSPRSAFARAMYGEVKPKTRRTLQFRFNQQDMNPQVLVAQAAVASEGLNLHEACRKVVLFHLDWNPAKIEQQIGRVDRQNSLWMQQFERWKASQHPSRSDPPQIEIHTIALAGTYDDHRSKVIVERQQMMRAQIFGELVPYEILAVLPQTLQDQIRSAAPDFSPL